MSNSTKQSSSRASRPTAASTAGPASSSASATTTTTTTTTTAVGLIQVRLRDKIKELMAQHSFDSASYWVDKLVTLSKGDTQDIVLMLECYLSSQQYKRAIGVFERADGVEETLYSTPKGRKSSLLAPSVPAAPSLHSTLKRKAYIRYLVAQCHAALSEWDNAQDVLGDSTESFVSLCDDYGAISASTKSAICLLRGKMYEALDNRLRASSCYQEALALNIYCHEALERLISERLLTPKQATDFLTSMGPEIISQGKEAPFLLELYLTDIARLGPNASSFPEDSPVEGTAEALQSLDMQTNRAEILYYYEHNAVEALKVTRAVVERDPFHLRCLTLHACCLVCVGSTNDLFALGHKLVQADSENAVTWFVVGCYYLSIGNNETARRYFSKSTAYNVRFAPAWIAFGHAFAADGEFDAALASYSTVSRLLSGSYLPLVFIGNCHLRSNNVSMAEQFFNEAYAIEPLDPLVIGELGVIAFRQKNYDEAKKRFNLALIRAAKDDNPFSLHLLDIWEPLLFNMGHCFRKLGEFGEAAQCYERALSLFPRNPSTFSALALCHQYMGDFSSAIELYHKALALQPDEPVATALLAVALSEHIRKKGTALL